MLVSVLFRDAQTLNGNPTVYRYNFTLLDSTFKKHKAITLDCGALVLSGQMNSPAVMIAALCKEYDLLKQPVSKNIVRAYLYISRNGTSIDESWLRGDAQVIELLSPNINYTKKYLPCVLREIKIAVSDIKYRCSYERRQV